jgi:hypothetical protein
LSGTVELTTVKSPEMDENEQVTWQKWWSLRPSRPRPKKRVVPFFETKHEEEAWFRQCKHEDELEYYATHRSAKLARWGVALGVLIAIVGFVRTFSFSGATDDAGYGLMIFGVLFTIVSIRFAAMLAVGTYRKRALEGSLTARSLATSRTRSAVRAPSPPIISDKCLP